MTADPDNYLAKVIQLARDEKVPWPKDQASGVRPSVLYYSPRYGLVESLATPEDVLVRRRNDQQSQNPTVCVVENITPRWIESLGAAWDLEPSFFVQHAYNPPSEAHWRTHEHVWNHGHSFESQSEPYFNMTGIFTHHGPASSWRQSEGAFFSRLSERRDAFSFQITTRISYVRVDAHLYLFLVDAPSSSSHAGDPHGTARSTLRLPYAANRGGLVVGGLYEKSQFRLTDCFSNMFAHAWHLNILFGQPAALPPIPLLYLLSSSLWESNIRYVDRQLRRISFVEIRNPDRNINNRLHDLREDLADIKARVGETNTYMHAGLAKYYDTFPGIKDRQQRTYMSPAEHHRVILDRATKLEAFLMDTFQLLMSSLSVRDSQMSIEQARRATLITYLAFIYVPLSFVTGVFGMNIKEINGSNLSVWVCFVALAIVAIITAAGTGVLLYQSTRERWIHK
ncbi:hypothetical protein LTR56_001629 [Elasticomyces elasticus]|nr:hypothetical protein LTR56_001629 [Elasticomyces elasticus]KAK4932601.1 hypothetical protein LTR49_001025 [Elasticomyces elasticus]KAK5769623.1 hypothetical protein LTS12_000073 [Elasticomyces elasticus]